MQSTYGFSRVSIGIYIGVTATANLQDTLDGGSSDNNCFVE